MNINILKAEKINKVYEINRENKQQVLHDIDISIAQGEFVSVMGPSGSGKSTLLYNVSGMDRATSGKIHFNGSNISEMSEEELSELRLKKMGFIFQQSNLLKNLNILDNIILSAYMLNKENRQTIVSRAEKLMEQTGISGIADNDITQASGGQLQRASICRALINRPAIVFADEPTGALNSKATAEVMDILLDINRTGTTLLTVTHNAKVAAQTDRVIFMSDGYIAGEKKLGKFTDSNALSSREQQLTSWLTDMGF